ncbi:hypothetical protein ACT476_002718 [Enterococcus faecium]
MKESEYNYRFLIKSNTSPPLKLVDILVSLVYHQLQDLFQSYGLSYIFEWFNPILHNFSGGLDVVQHVFLVVATLIFIASLPIVYKRELLVKNSEGQ